MQPESRLLGQSRIKIIITRTTGIQKPGNYAGAVLLAYLLGGSL